MKGRLSLMCRAGCFPLIDPFTCMGREVSVGLRDALRGGDRETSVDGLVREALSCKPKGHSFQISRQAVNGIARHMSVLGG